MYLQTVPFTLRWVSCSFLCVHTGSGWGGADSGGLISPPGRNEGFLLSRKQTECVKKMLSWVMWRWFNRLFDPNPTRWQRSSFYCLMHKHCRTGWVSIERNSITRFKAGLSRSVRACKIQVAAEWADIRLYRFQPVSQHIRLSCFKLCGNET